MTTTARTIAQWATGLDDEWVPGDVRELCRAQRRSVLAAVAGAAGDRSVARLRDAVAPPEGSGPVPVAGAPGRRAGTEAALYAAAAAAIALDHDDYACFGHTGHSAVLVPVLLAAETGADAATQLRAQAAANEVACRLGGVSLLGPQNGQLWTAIHAAGAALAAAIVMGLPGDRAAHALALALAQPPRAVAPALVGSDSKLLLAAEPAVLGVRAARLAAAGLEGPVDDVLGHPQGYVAAFADVPLAGMLESLGQAWATRTLSVKPAPGCAYLTSVVEALHELGPPPAGDVARVEVATSLATSIMDALSAPMLDGRVPSPSTVTFSTPLTVAATLHAGRLTPAALRHDWLEARATELHDLARRVDVTHAPDLTAATARSFAAVVAPTRLLRDTGVRGAVALRRRTAGGGLDRVGPELLRAAVSVLRGGRAGVARRHFDPATLGRFRMALPARVTVHLRDGTSRRALVEVPRGAAGHPDVPPQVAARDKLTTHGPGLWGPGGTAAIDEAVERDAPDLAAHL